MQENRQNGHLYMPPEEYLSALEKLINHNKDSYQMPEGDLRAFANEAFGSGEIIYSRGCIYLKNDHMNEHGCAVLMARRIAYDRSRSIVPFPGEIVSEISISPEQESAVRMALMHNTSIITGGQGTGKTTTLQTLLKMYNGDKAKILLCAPTGRAARRMAEATGYPAFTIHKSFGLGSEDSDENDTVIRRSWELVVMDEASMADQWIMFQILRRLSPETKLVIVGDSDQLPSVGPGNVLHELLQVKEIPRVQLKQVFRQAANSAIAENARRVAAKETELTYDDSFVFVPVNKQAEAMDIICELYKRASSKLGADKVQILTPQRKNGECGANTLNTIIQMMIQGNVKAGKKVFNDYFCVGDPVIQIKNQKGIYNGDIGVVSEAMPNVKVDFPSLDLSRTYDNEALQMLELAYALTVHKSQGSEYPIVIIPVLREHRFMLTRNLFYTAISRGKQRVVLVGRKSAIKKAILTEDTSKRLTLLASRIQRELSRMENKLCVSEKIKESA